MEESSNQISTKASTSSKQEDENRDYITEHFPLPAKPISPPHQEKSTEALVDAQSSTTLNNTDNNGKNKIDSTLETASKAEEISSNSNPLHSDLNKAEEMDTTICTMAGKSSNRADLQPTRIDDVEGKKTALFSPDAPSIDFRQNNKENITPHISEAAPTTDSSSNPSFRTQMDVDSNNNTEQSMSYPENPNIQAHPTQPELQANHTPPVYTSRRTTRSSTRSSARSSARSSSRPTRRSHWCHQCQREVNVMMAPNPICAICNSDFVEEIDPTNDPRDFVMAEDINIEDSTMHRSSNRNDRSTRINPTLDQADNTYSRNSSQELALLLNQLISQISGRPPNANRAPTENVEDYPIDHENDIDTFGPYSSTWNPRSHFHGEGYPANFREPTTSDNRRESISSDDTSTDQPPIGQSANQPSHQNAGQATDQPTNQFTERPQLFSRSFGNNGATFTFYRAGNSGVSNENPLVEGNENVDVGNRERPLDFPGILGALFGGLGSQPNIFAGQDLFSTLFGTAGNVGDYAWGPNGLDDIITQLMEQAQGRNAPPPCSEELINSLPRKKLDEEALKEHKECGICMDEYEVSDTIVELSCHHQFHEDCIVKWLKVNGTCPICRVLIKPSKEKEGEDDGTNVNTNTNTSNENENGSNSAHSSLNADFIEEHTFPGAFPSSRRYS